MVDKPEKKWAKCVACGYEWKTRTPLRHVSCPNCRHTNKTAEVIALYITSHSDEGECVEAASTSESSLDAESA